MNNAILFSLQPSGVIVRLLVPLGQVEKSMFTQVLCPTVGAAVWVGRLPVGMIPTLPLQEAEQWSH